MDEKQPASNAERQRAHRQRVKDRLAGLPPLAPPLKKPSQKPTRPKQLGIVINILNELESGYEGWLTALPANLAESEVATQLQETIDHLRAALAEVEAIEPPRIGR